jgi:site-specific recombinase XerD
MPGRGRRRLGYPASGLAPRSGEAGRGVPSDASPTSRRPLNLRRPIPTTLTLASAAQIMREAVKDKSYRATPLGLLVGRYLRWFRNEWGATATTIRDYEAILARMALTLADREPLEVTVDDLRDVIDLWANREARTRAKVTSVIRAFWTWAEEQDHVPFSPAAKLRRPRAPRKSAPLLPLNTDARLLNATKQPRDRCALLLLLDAGLRRSELSGVRVHDIDLSRRQITVFGKGQKSRVIPLRGRLVLELEHYMLEPLPLLGRPPEPDDFLLYPEKRTEGGRILAAYPKRRMSGPTIHRWWYRNLQAADLVGAGMTSGLNMHRARHTFATDLRRVADLGAASQALGHSDLSTTASIYGHYDLSDLERAMEALAKARRAEDEEPAD